MEDKGINTAGIIIIGNEILSGKVQDVNSYYLAAELRSLGVDVRRISVIPDELDVIGKEARDFSVAYDFVFTTGGVGPTHDDVTMEGIAQGFGVRLVRSPLIRNILSSLYDSMNDAVLKMADVPDGSDIIFNEKMRFPVVNFKNIYIFPGIPGYLKNKFPLIRERFASSSIYLNKIFLKTRESDVAAVLSELDSSENGITIGSYPILECDDFNLIVTVESRSMDSLERAMRKLIEKLPGEGIIKIE
ncbi:MAG: competence/damage-inducible protein A [Thermodesulfovibrionia bacterium]|nr:competence/damage-inducible protein A [Thermodesulfovibrionia bacterium]